MVGLVAAQVVAPACAQWYAAVDFVMPTRSDFSPPVLARNQVVSGGETRVGSQTLLSGDDLPLDFVAGGRIVVGNRAGILGAEGSYMRTDNWHETASAFDSGAMLASPFTAVGALVDPTLDNNSSIVADYETQLESAEVHLAHRVYSGSNGDLSLLYGARYLGIDESLRYLAIQNGPPVNTNSLAIGVDNRLIGPQIGALIESPLYSGSVNFVFKTALAYHDTNKTTVFNGAVAQGSDQGAALVGEFDVNASFFITPRLHLRLGYQLLAITDVALATDNFESDTTVLNSGAANIKMKRGLIYHGPYIGLVLVR